MQRLPSEVCASFLPPSVRDFAYSSEIRSACCAGLVAAPTSQGGLPGRTGLRLLLLRWLRMVGPVARVSNGDDDVQDAEEPFAIWGRLRAPDSIASAERLHRRG